MHRSSCKFKAVNVTVIISLHTQFIIKRVVTTNNNYAPPAVCCLKKFSGMNSTECSAMNLIAVIMYVNHIIWALLSCWTTSMFIQMVLSTVEMQILLSSELGNTTVIKSFHAHCARKTAGWMGTVRSRESKYSHMYILLTENLCTTTSVSICMLNL